MQADPPRPPAVPSQWHALIPARSTTGAVRVVGFSGIVRSSKRAGVMKKSSVVLALALLAAACGGPDANREPAVNDLVGEAGSSGDGEPTPTDAVATDSAVETENTTTATTSDLPTDPAVADQDSAAATDESGYWTAAQLCTLFDDDEVTNLFGASAQATAFEQAELEDLSICSWPDPDSSEALPPTLILVRQELNDGQDIQFGEGVTITGADYVDHRPAWLPGRDFLVLKVADQQILFDYVADTPGAYDVVIAAATEWVTNQADAAPAMTQSRRERL